MKKTKAKKSKTNSKGTLIQVSSRATSGSLPVTTQSKRQPGAPEDMLKFQEMWAYSPAPEDSKWVKIKPKYDLFINGRWQQPTGDRYFEAINPAREERLSMIAEASELDVDSAYQAAQHAYDHVWSKMPAIERGKYLFRIARAIQERSREISIIETLDNGKPIRESKAVDIPLAAAHFFYHAGWADKLEYAFPHQTISSLGVIGQVIPWNFPFLMLAWKIAPALACGNTVVLKPAETTSLTALLFAEICEQVGLPKGVVNIVTGGPKTGEAVVRHKLAKKLAFTGSTEVGKRIIGQVQFSKKLTLELGGKSPNLIFEDAPIDQAVEGIVNGIFFNQGHVCCAGSRLLVQESVVTEVLTKLKIRMNSLIVGDPLDKNTDIGAINSKAQLEKIETYLSIGKKEGVLAFERKGRMPSKGFWCAPTLFYPVPQSSKLSREEIFGPVLTVQTFRDEAEAISKANNTEFGLAAGIWSSKGSRIFKLTQELRAGVIWANTYNKFDPTSPFGGFKESGYGREGGIHGLSEYLKVI